MPGYDPGLTNPQPDGTQSLTGNQAAAQQLLAAAQATCPSFVSSFDKTHAYCHYISKSNPLEIDVYVRNQKQTEVDLVTAATQEWSNVLGLNVKPVIQDTDTYFGSLLALDPNTGLNMNPDQMWSLGWSADYPDPEDWLTTSS